MHSKSIIIKEFGCRANGEANKTAREESRAMKENVILPAPQTPTRTKACTYTQNIHLCMCVYPGILPAHVGPRDSGIPTCGQTNGLIKSLTPRAARENTQNGGQAQCAGRTRRS